MTAVSWVKSVRVVEYIHPTPPLRVICYTKSILKRSKADLKQFSFYSTGYLIKAKGTQSALLFAHGWKEKRRIHAILKGVSEKWISPRIWTRTADSISYGDNRNTSEHSYTLKLWIK